MTNLLASVRYREAVSADIRELAELHVRTWAATYPLVKNPPTFEIREWQWNRKFASEEPGWFCYVVEDEDGRMIGFAQGQRYSHPELPDYSGELNKIYLEKSFHGQGIGKRMMGLVAWRFLSGGVDSMVLFAEPSNPTCGFYEALDGERIYDEDGRFHGAYGWKDLTALASRCRTK